MKKAQITLFIIIGLVILAVAGSVLYFTLRPAEVSTQLQLEQVPREVEPVRNFVQSCVETVALDALTVLGEQGGYINLIDNGIAVNYADMTEGNAVDFTSIVPYWYYLESDNGCTGTCYFGQAKIALKKTEGDLSFESELESYFEQNFESCIADFLGYEAFEISAEKPKFDVSIDDVDVKFNVEYPLTVSTPDVQSKISKFYYVAPINLKRIYEKAKEITASEASYCFLESFALFKVSEFSGVNQNSLPPISDVKFTTTGVYWISKHVEDRLKSIIQTYTPFLQLTASNNFKRVRVPETTENKDLIQRSFDNMIVPVDGSGFDIYFNYFANWPIYFRTNHGALIKPSSMYVPLINLGVQKYDTTYDFSYPVIVEMRDPKALNSQGYSFKFGLEANVRHNLCLESEYDPLIPVRETGDSQLCDIEQRNSGDVTIQVKGPNQEPASNIIVSYVAGEKCLIGETDGQGKLTAKFPVGIGELQFEHPEYLTFTKPIHTEVDIPAEEKVTLYKKTVRPAIIMKKNLQKSAGWSLNDYPSPLSTSEEGIVILERISDDGYDEYTTMLSYTGNDTEKTSVEIYPGKYQVTMIVIDYDRLYIPPSSRKVGGFLKKKTVNIPAVDLESWQSGGLEFNEVTGYWELQPGSLLASNEIRFYAAGLQRADMQVVEDLNMLGEFETYSGAYKTALTPELIIR